MSEPLLSCRDVLVEYPGRGFRARPFRALHGVSLAVRAGETFGLVGESGSGKTTLARAVLGLAPVSAGSIAFRGREITQLRGRERRALSEEIQVVFQDPYSSLNPARTVADILTEPLRVGGMARNEAERRVRDLLDLVRLPADAGERLPREFSGGQRQRVAIARALSRSPRLVVCDEPVSALDPRTQSHVLELLVEIQETTGVAYLFITHDLTVVRYVCHRVAVMFRGDIVESGDADRLTTSPAHAYTRRLMLAAPVADPARQAERRAARLTADIST
jgi:peptide/nickel transport system ATP-binding protein